MLEAVKAAAMEASAASVEAIDGLTESYKAIADSVQEIKVFVEKKELEDIIAKAEDEIKEEAKEFQDVLDEAEFLVLVEKAVESMEESGTIVSKKKKKKQ